MAPPVALAHDYLTQKGGAERVVLAFTKAFPDAPLYTSLYEPALTFPEFASVDVRTLGVNRLGPVRRNHLLALPVLAPSFGRLQIDAGVVLASSSGWAHGLHTSGRKVVFCHTPARWLYQREQYLRESGPGARLALGALAPYLRRWDRRAAGSADRYLANSSVVRDRIRESYGIDAAIVHPPHGVDPLGSQEPVLGVEPPFYLCVSRLKPYKNVDAVVEAFDKLGTHRLVVVGEGPDRDRLDQAAGAQTTLIGGVTDAQLRWLYARCSGVVAASYEDYGLTPLEAAAFGKPSVVLRAGGFLDTVVEGTTGVFFGRPDAVDIARAVEEASSRGWDVNAILAHAESRSEEHFVERIRAIVSGSASTAEVRGRVRS